MPGIEYTANAGIDLNALVVTCTGLIKASLRLSSIVREWQLKMDSVTTSNARHVTASRL